MEKAMAEEKGAGESPQKKEGKKASAVHAKLLPTP